MRKTNALTLIEKYAYAEYNNPIKKGDYYYTRAYYSNHTAPALFYQKNLKFDPRILVDPNFISTKDVITLKGYYPSADSELLAYQFARNGSDWAELKVVSLKNGRHRKDHLQNLKFSPIAWKDDGFFYATFPKANQFGKTEGQQIYYHKIGTPQEEDKLIFRRERKSLRFRFMITSDERFFLLKELDDEKGEINVFYIDYEAEQPALKPLLMKLDHDLDVLDSHDGKLVATSFYKTNNGNVIKIDPENPRKWRAIVGEYADALLMDAIPMKEKIVVIYQLNQHPILIVFDYVGNLLYEKVFPAGSSIGGFNGEPEDEEFFFDYNSYTVPPVVYNFNVNTFEEKLTQKTGVSFNFKDIQYEEVEYAVNDTTKVPMILVYEKGMVRDGTNPVILKAYGGFGIVSRPHFDPSIVYFIKEGGIFAFANIRGGGDFGKSWAKQGKGFHKQNSFDDFIAAAEYLIDNNYTSPEKLAATGGSNGGLVVAAAAIQRPDLFKAVVPVMAPLDMLRFEKFTVGRWWADEYGTVSDKHSFLNLKNYSPYHNIKKDMNYPAMLLVTGENDDRVPPFHTYKFVAALQNRTAQKNPILMQSLKKAGHYGAATRSGALRERAQQYAFMVGELLD